MRQMRHISMNSLHIFVQKALTEDEELELALAMSVEGSQPQASTSAPAGAAASASGPAPGSAPAASANAAKEAENAYGAANGANTQVCYTLLPFPHFSRIPP